MKQSIKKYVCNILLILVFTGLALWFALKDNTQEILSVLEHVSIYGVLGVFLCVLLYQGCVGWVLTQFAKEIKPDYKLWEGYENAMVASFFHGITPSASGGQFAQAYVFHKQGIPVEKSAGLLVMDFIVYQATMLVITASLLILRYHYFAENKFFLLAIGGFLINLAVIVVLLVGSMYPKVYTWMVKTSIRLCAKFRIIKDQEAAIASANEKLVHFDQGMKDIRENPKLLCKVVIGNAAKLLLLFSVPILCAKALHIPCTTDALTMIALTSFVINVNSFIPIPGASGGTESTFVVMYSMIMSKVEASSIMVLWRFGTYHFLMIVGALVFIKVQNSRSKS